MSSKDEHRIRRNLEILRAVKGISQAELATMVGVDQEQISKFESGPSPVTLRMVFDVCRALDVSLDTVNDPVRFTKLIGDPARANPADTVSRQDDTTDSAHPLALNPLDVSREEIPRSVKATRQMLFPAWTEPSPSTIGYTEDALTALAYANLTSSTKYTVFETPRFFHDVEFRKQVLSGCPKTITELYGESGKFHKMSDRTKAREIAPIIRRFHALTKSED